VRGNENDAQYRRHIGGKGIRIGGNQEKTTLVKLGLEALIAKESAKRLAKLGGTQKQLKAIPRRRIAER
jgi:hypothetical protein